eukprot:gnl/TRDRNA2_/TRDRNA2_151938_c0_seq2.p1 gnl/TRDRNA2_/TRDRNA2_151938_c0~~gnl/TRDRNA2_/TRDRNA2_151938_c0_seq2.p1  ORF type:complete len:272 (-),score=45.43 gnl/TRDRNA2_/TRDRNA2_151938_c0_seq2:620-1321(-)
MAAMVNRRAMQAIYVEAHPQSCLGIRQELAKHVPEDAKLIIDLGAGDGDGPAAVARARPSARVLAVEASPFMIICGRRQNSDVTNLEFVHALAEDTGLPSGEADAVTITLLFHECSDEAKSAIGHEAMRLLRPDGVLVFADTPPDDLDTYRGFYEPHKEAWMQFDGPSFLRGSMGLVDVQDHGILGAERATTSEEHRSDNEFRTDNVLFHGSCRRAGPWYLGCRASDDKRGAS